MSNRSGLLTITVPWRRVCAALPAVALIGAGIAVSAPAAPAHNFKAVSSDSPAIVVPDTALSMPAPAGVGTEDPYAKVPEAPAPAVSKDAVPDSSSQGTFAGDGIPVRALEGYRRAASLIDAADRTCHIDWALLAAIGRVESNHGRFGGNRLDAAGVAQPGIIGIPLDGSNGTARILDTDGGRLDRDAVYDRAVGPMQFIPSTWRVVGADADGDGVKNPQDMADAATSTAIYLCSGPGDLTNPGDLHGAIMRYNASDSYVQMVIALAATYRLGVSALPDTGPAPSATASGQTGTLPNATPGQQPAATAGAATPISPTLAPALPVPGAPVTTTPVTTTPVVTTPPPATTAPDPTPTTPPVTTPPVTTAPDPTPTATAITPTPTPTV